MQTSSKQNLNVLIVAGEASGDTHAAKLIDALKDLNGESQIAAFGAAGPKMRNAGVEATVKADELSIVGLLEIGRALPMFWSAFRSILAAAEERKPDVAILVDFPDFNMKLAKSLKKRGIKVVYYISPQLWAWRKYRLRTIKRSVDLLLSILPFEKEWYAKNGFERVEYVGNPLAREVHPTLSKEEFCDKHGLDASRPIVALLPGSRRTEITRILPLLLETADKLSSQVEGFQSVVALPDGASQRFDLPDKDTRPWMKWVEGETFDALNAADAAAITSGTATLEAGIIGTPMAIVYKASALNYKLLRPLIKVEHFGLINLIAGHRVANEFIQDDFTPETLSREIGRLLQAETNAKIRAELRSAAEKLGRGGASKRAAKAILACVYGHSDDQNA